MNQVDDKTYRDRVYEIVRQVPSGRVMTYGQIAEILGEGYTPRTVGYVMHGADSENVPWQRVINSQGACSTGTNDDADEPSAEHARAGRYRVYGKW
jgi:methylated-DNA-protein-cysteine methyltransferase-like protein